MIIEIAFIFTACAIITGFFKMFGAMIGNGVTLPAIIPFTEITPTHYIIMYPSVMFQVWFWSNKLGVFA